SRHHGEAETHQLNDRAIRDRLSQPDFSVTWRKQPHSFCRKWFFPYLQRLKSAYRTTAGEPPDLYLWLIAKAFKFFRTRM
ncbi:hypothetical protein N7320_15275, partial [Stutzerimonas stutzeri]|uniref:hypothetical protein n=1 Tax=Stutzerimonas stutzeri TaxID=316 RepID=UPI00244D2E5D